MIKMKKILLCLVMITILCLLFTTICYANISDKNIEVMVEKKEKNVINDTITEYFALNEKKLNGDKVLISDYINAKSFTVSDEDNYISNEKKSLNIKEQIESYYNINVTNAEINANVKNIVLNREKKGFREYYADVYEWTWIDYTSEDSICVDRMGYGIEHKMIFVISESGKPIIIENSYDDSYIIGDSNLTENLELDNSFVNEEKMNNKVLTLNQNNLNIYGLISYADTYVMHGIAPDPYTSYTQYYNPEYEWFYGNDCANYVSQCLRAGGLPDDHSLPTTWWYDNSRSPKCTKSWKTVSNMQNYFEGEGLSKNTIKSNFSNVFPGNPVIVYNGGHVAICVGYNSQGVPIINGHTRDVYHQPLVRGKNAYYYTYKVFPYNYL